MQNIFTIIIFLVVNVFLLDGFYLLRYCIPSIYEYCTDLYFLLNINIETLFETVLFAIFPLLTKLFIFYVLYKLLLRYQHIKSANFLLQNIRENRVFQRCLLMLLWFVVPIFCKPLVTHMYYSVFDYLQFMLWYNLFYGSGLLYLLVFAYWRNKDKHIENKSL